MNINDNRSIGIYGGVTIFPLCAPEDSDERFLGSARLDACNYHPGLVTVDIEPSLWTVAQLEALQAAITKVIEYAKEIAAAPMDNQPPRGVADNLPDAR